MALIAWNPYLSLWMIGSFRAIYTSPDAITWTERIEPTLSIETVNGIAYDNLYTVCASALYNGQITTTSTNILWTTDGITYNKYPTNFTNQFFSSGQCVATDGNGNWAMGGVAGASTISNTLCYTSGGPTGLWTADGSGIFTTSCLGMAYGNGIWVAGGAGANGTLAYSTTSPPTNATWTLISSGPFDTGGSCNSVIWTGSTFIAAGTNSGATAAIVATSPNGITWTTVTAPSMTTVNTLSYSVNNFNFQSYVDSAGTLGSATSYWNNIYTNAITYGNNNKSNVGYQAGYTGQGTVTTALGYQAAYSTQGIGSVAIGYQAGFTGQKSYTVAIGYQAGYTGHGTGSIAIGYQAGYADAPGPHSIAIGTQAGQYGLGSNSIAIGNLAGPTGAGYSNNIILNANGSALNPGTGSALYVAPVRVSTDTSNVMVYNTTTNEVTYNTGKTFIIDHPIESSKYLVHACLEGPENGVYYRGKGTITPNTTTTVITLPSYVPAFANNFTVQITPIYMPGQTTSLYSASEIIGNTFDVHGQPGSFYWHVHGSRGELLVEPLRSDVVVRGDGPYKYIL